MVTEGNGQTKIVLTKPLPLEADSDADYRAPPNLLQRILSLFRNVRSGSDLTRFQLPPHFNLPKSHLQLYGESVYCVGSDILSRCNNAESSLERILCVVAWSISTARPFIFGVAPYNPVLGETHHVSRGSLNVLLEQVSHHPPVSALHATDEKENVEVIWCQHPVSTFRGASVETEVLGKRQLKLLNHKETYVMNSPKFLIRFFPVPGVDWVGSVRIQCQETGLEAKLCYKGSSFGGLGGNPRSIRGTVFDSSSLKVLYAIEGRWDRTVTAKGVNDGIVRVIYNAREVLSGLKGPTIKDLQGIRASESAVVWSSVSEAILNKDWEKAREAKGAVEDEQRQLLKKRDSDGEGWVPKHFSVSYSKESGWEGLPLENRVPPAPLIVPL